MSTPAPALQKAKRWLGYRKMPSPLDSTEAILSKRHPLLHGSSVVGYGALLYAAIHDTKYATGVLLLLLFMLITSVPMLLRNWKMLLLILGIVAVSATFPPLAPVFLIVFVLFYMRRLLMVLTHWRPVLSGMLLYTSVIFVQGIAVVTDSSSSSLVADAARTRAGVALFVVPFGAFCFHRLLHWLNRHHYNTQTALAVMGVFPLLVLALVMPLFKFDLGIEVPEIPAETPAGGLVAEGSLVAEGTLAAQSSTANVLEASTAQQATLAAQSSTANALEASTAQQATLQAQETTVLTGLNNAKTAIATSHPTAEDTNTSVEDTDTTTQDTDTSAEDTAIEIAEEVADQSLKSQRHTR